MDLKSLLDSPKPQKKKILKILNKQTELINKFRKLNVQCIDIINQQSAIKYHLHSISYESELYKSVGLSPKIIKCKQIRKHLNLYLELIDLFDVFMRDLDLHAKYTNSINTANSVNAIDCTLREIGRSLIEGYKLQINRWKMSLNKVDGDVDEWTACKCVDGGLELSLFDLVRILEYDLALSD